MTHPENEFGDFENDFKETEKAQAGSAIGLVPEETYKVFCCQQDLSGDGVLVDHEVFTANTGTKGFKLFLEIHSPDTVVDPDTGETVKTKGQIVEKVFWISQKNLAYLKRDIATILGRDLKSLSELTQITWVGLSCEVGVSIKTNKRGYKENDVGYINPWTPESGKKETAPAAAATTAPAGSAAPPKETLEGDPEF